MFGSLRARISLVIAGIIIGTTAVLCYTVQREVGRSFGVQTELSARNILNSIAAGVNNEYQSIQFSREQQYLQRKAELRNMVELATHILDRERQKVQSGLLSEPEAQLNAQKLIRSLRYDNNVGYFWVLEFKPKSLMLVHGLMPELEGTYVEEKYDYIPATGERLQSYFYRNCLAKGECYAEYNWPKARTGGYSEATPKVTYVRLYKPWNWMLGSGMYVDDIEKTVQVRQEAVIKELRETFAKLRIGENGYAFIFNGNHKMLVHPGYTRPEDQLADSTDMGRNLMAKICELSKVGIHQMDYQWLKPGDKKGRFHEKTVFFEYFKPLDFYICLSYYSDDLKQPIRQLNQRLLILSVVLLLISLAVALWLAWNLVAPLRRLAFAADAIGRKGMNAANIPISGSRETRELGQILGQVMETIRRQESSLKAGEENLRITLESIGDAVIASDTLGRIVRMNRAAEIITEWKFEDACGKTLFEGISLADSLSAEPIANPIDTVLASGKPCSLSRKTVLSSRNGNRKLIDDSCAPILSVDNRLLGVVIVFRDITDQVHMELQLLQSQKMESLGQLAGGVAHDFNNMLAGIMASAEILKRKLTPEQTRLLEYTNIIISTCERAADLTGKLLAFSRKGKIFSSPTDVHQSIADSITLLSRSIDKRVTVVGDFDAFRSTVIGDPAQLQTMILNLGINAAHAMPDGGCLRISTRNVPLDEDFCRNCREFAIQPGEYIEIKVADKGTGIPPEFLSRIFEPFFTTKQMGHGTGLGLASVYGSVKEHHGMISVDSTLGEGTVFTILLPLSEEHASAVAAKPLPLPDSSFKGDVLLVDDEAIIRSATGAVLEEAGLHVVQASDGEEALEIYRRNPQRFDVVIMDMVMPRMNGEDCFYAMLKINPAVKIVLISGFTNEAKVTKMKQQGLIALLKKPFRQRDLFGLITPFLKSETTPKQ